MRTILVPLALVCSLLATVVVVGQVTLRMNTTSTKASIELLEMHLEVARYHKRLMRGSADATRSHLRQAKDKGAPEPRDPSPTTPPPARKTHAKETRAESAHRDRHAGHGSHGGDGPDFHIR